MIAGSLLPLYKGKVYKDTPESADADPGVFLFSEAGYGISATIKRYTF